jgi:hypothetical protein
VKQHKHKNGYYKQNIIQPQYCKRKLQMQIISNVLRDNRSYNM